VVTEVHAADLDLSRAAVTMLLLPGKHASLRALCHAKSEVAYRGLDILYCLYPICEVCVGAGMQLLSLAKARHVNRIPDRQLVRTKIWLHQLLLVRCRKCRETAVLYRNPVVSGFMRRAKSLTAVCRRDA